MNNRYGRLASWVYDLDKPVGRSFGDVEFYRRRLTGCAGPVLEPAVGNGRLLVPLLESGLVMHGFDASEEMLDCCRRQCRARSLPDRLSQQALESFSYELAFEAIVIPAGSFQLITDLPSAKAVLRRFHDHLAPGGRLIVDIGPIDAFLGASRSIRSWRTENDDLLTLADDRVETNFIEQTTLSHLRYEHWQGGSLVATELDLFRLRWWGVDELAMALREAGFIDVLASGNYEDGRAPRKGDEAISFEARRP